MKSYQYQVRHHQIPFTKVDKEKLKSISHSATKQIIDSIHFNNRLNSTQLILFL